jgi:signal transduction histidine kinase
MSDPIRILMVDQRTIGGECVDCLPVEKHETVIRAIQRVFDFGETESIEYEDTNDKWWQIRIVLVEQSGHGKRAAIISTDITERKRAESEILERQKRFRLLASESSLAEEKERKRISMELHDRIGQPLLALKLMIGSLRESIDMPELTSFIDEMDILLGRTIEDTRSLTSELSPPILYILGFEAAIEWLVEQNEKRYAIDFEFQSDRRCRPLDTDLEVFLFQAVRELLTNVGKHAHASVVRVTISSDEESVRIRVEDDGVGFDVFTVDRFKDGDKGFGLFSIRERLFHLGGSVRMMSKSNRGTKITLIAPLKTTRRAGSCKATTG